MTTAPTTLDQPADSPGYIFGTASVVVLSLFGLACTALPVVTALYGGPVLINQELTSNLVIFYIISTALTPALIVLATILNGAAVGCLIAVSRRRERLSRAALLIRSIALLLCLTGSAVLVAYYLYYHFQ